MSKMISMERPRISAMGVVRQKSTGLYLRMQKFDSETKEPVYGPLEKAWIALSYEQAEAQAAFLGDDHEAVKLQ